MPNPNRKGGNPDGEAQRQLAIQHELVKYAIGLAPLPPRPPESLLFEVGEGGTENYKLEGKAIGWAWSVAANDPDARKWRAELLTYLRGERHEFMGAEQMAPDPHMAMYLAGHGVPHLYASLPQYRDEEILAETRWWWSSTFAVCRACSTPDGTVIAPCCNCRKPQPSQSGLSALWRRRMLFKARSLPAAEKLATDRTLAGYWAMVQPASRLNDIPVARELPRMRCSMHVERVDDGYNAWIDPPTAGRVAGNWVCSRVEVRGGELVRVEKSWAEAA